MSDIAEGNAFLPGFQERFNARFSVTAARAENSLPDDHDVVLVANAVHMFSVVHNLELLQKSRAAVQAGAQLLLVDLWTDPTHSNPAAAALMSGAFLLTSGEGQTYSEQDAGEWLNRTGWRKRERKALAGATSLIVAEAI